MRQITRSESNKMTVAGLLKVAKENGLDVKKPSEFKTVPSQKRELRDALKDAGVMIENITSEGTLKETQTKKSNWTPGFGW